MASAQELRRSVKGLSEAGFRERFGTEEACREALLGMRWRDGLTCPACGHRGFCRLETRQPFQCNRCKWQDPFPTVLAQSGRAHPLAIRLARPALGRSRAKEEAMT